ncbi:MAG: hypothetical protein KC636_11885 [Myxococcales bacterium]|nr:hypothetical protein [Myxococcales bacterium]
MTTTNDLGHARVVALCGALLFACGDDSTSTDVGTSADSSAESSGGETTTPTTAGTASTSAGSDSSSGTAGPTTDGETTDGETTDGETTDAPATDTATTDEPTTDGETTDTATTDGETTDEPTTDATTDEPGVCGDGQLGPDELCDDGNLDADDGCEADCTWTPCAILWSQKHKIEGKTLFGMAIAPLPDGHAAIAVTEDPAQLDARLRLMRVDETGAALWSALVLDARSEAGGVGVDADGTIYVTGVDIDAFPRDYSAGYDGDGNQLWTKIDLFPEASETVAAAPLPDGDVIFAGRRTLAKSSWLARVSPGGAVAWKQEFVLPDTTITQLYAVVADEQGIYASGSARVEGATGSAGAVARFDLDGGVVWSQTPTVEGISLQVRDVWVGPEGQVGFTGEYFTANNGVKPGSDIWSGVYSPDGELVWEALYDNGDGKTYDRGDGVVVDGFGNTLIVGTVLEGTYRAHLRKYDSSGALLCAKTIDAADGLNSMLHDVTFGDDGLPRVTGYANKELYVAALTP